MGKIFYTLYALTVISIMSNFSYSPSSAQSFWSNANSQYHGGSWGSGSSSGGGGGGHK